LNSKVFPGPFTDLSACLGFCTSIPQQGVKYQLWYLKKKIMEGSLYKYSMKNILRTAKFLPTFGYFKGIPLDIFFYGIFIETPPPQFVFKYQNWYFTPCCGLEVHYPT
jgi:hypothetical protein